MNRRPRSSCSPSRLHSCSRSRSSSCSTGRPHGPRAPRPRARAHPSPKTPAPPRASTARCCPGGASAPDFTLTDQRGRRVSLGQYRGQVTILTFLYSTCRPTCPLIAQQIRGALDELGQNPVPVLIVSADPAADTPAPCAASSAKPRSMAASSISPAPLPNCKPVWRAYDIVPAQLGDANSTHAASVLLIDRAGQKRDLFQAEQLTPESLAHDIRKLERDPAYP